MNAKSGLAIEIISIFFIAFCSAATHAQTALPDSAPRQLVKREVLITGNFPIFSAFGDVDGDNLLDMVIGSKGHKYSDGNPENLQANVAFSKRKQLSFHLATSSTDESTYAKPYWLDDLIEDPDLPMG